MKAALQTSKFDADRGVDILRDGDHVRDRRQEGEGDVLEEDGDTRALRVRNEGLHALNEPVAHPLVRRVDEAVHRAGDGDDVGAVPLGGEVDRLAVAVERVGAHQAVDAVGVVVEQRVAERGELHPLAVEPAPGGGTVGRAHFRRPAVGRKNHHLEGLEAHAGEMLQRIEAGVGVEVGKGTRRHLQVCHRVSFAGGDAGADPRKSGAPAAWPFVLLAHKCHHSAQIDTHKRLVPAAARQIQPWGSECHPACSARCACGARPSTTASWWRRCASTARSRACRGDGT